MKFLCEHCKAKYQIADDKVAGRTVRMKCRKCGGSIEVKAEVTETSVAMKAADLAAGEPRSSQRPGPLGAGAAPRPAAPPRPAAQNERALAGAFQRSVHREDDGRSLRELSAADEWYVAVNGVPVGPVRVGEVRRKAAMGAVTEDSLCWQEGMEEWRAIRTVTELAAVVREAASGGRASLAPGEVRQTPAPVRPAAPRAPQPAARPHAAAGPAWSRPVTAPMPAQFEEPDEVEDEGAATIVGRSPLLDAEQEPHAVMTNGAPHPPAADPFHSRDQRSRPPAAYAGPATGFGGPGPQAVPATGFGAPAPHTSPATGFGAPAGGFGAAPGGFGAPSPYAPPAPAAPPPGYGAFQPVPVAPAAPPPGAPFAPGASGFGSVAPPAPAPPIVVPAVSRRMSPIAVGMIVMFACFGLAAAFLVFGPHAVRAPPPVASAPPVVSAAAPIPTDIPPPVAATATTAPVAAPDAGGTRVASATPRGPVGSTPKPGPSGVSTDPALRELLGGPTGPSTGPGNGGPGAAGPALNEDSIKQVVSQHSLAIRRTCWDRSTSTTPSVKVVVHIEVNGSGQVTQASANGNDPVVARCLENEIRLWRWPGGGEVNVPFSFIRQ